MRKILLSLIFLLCAVPALAQDTDVCLSTIETAVEATQTNCGDLEANQICYGSGTIEAIPRYLTAEFEFDEPGAILDVTRMETGQLLPPPSDDSYNIAWIELQAGLPDELGATVQMALFGEAFIANNVIPSIELDVTTNTLAIVQNLPSDFSEEVTTLVPGEMIVATGRIGDPESTEETWVRVLTDFGSGWVTANVLEEDFLLPSLPQVEAKSRYFAPMQSLTLATGINDRACADAPDSGLLVKVPSARTELRINNIDITLDPNSSVYVQARANATVDIYVLEGGITAGETIGIGGEVVSFPSGLEAEVSETANPPTAYANNKVLPLLLVTAGFDDELLIVRGVDTPADTTASSEVVPAEVTEPEVALLPTDEPVTEATEDISLESEIVVIPATEEVVIAEEAAERPTEELVAVEETSPVVAEEVTAAPVEGSGGVLEASSPLAESIRANGTIRVGVNGSLPTFSIEEGDDVVGFEPTLAREVVRRLFGDTVTIEWVQVSARQRQSALTEGRVDLMMRNTSFAPEREAWGEWTNTFYFVDGQRFLVRADSGITSIGDLAGQPIGVQASTPAETILNAIAEEQGLTIIPLQGTLIELLNRLDSGEVVAISSDWTALESIRQTTDNPNSYAVVGNTLTDITWSAAVPPGQTEFRNEVDNALLTIIEDGTWQTVYAEWFDSELPASLAVIFAPGTTVAAEVVEVEPTPMPEVADEPAVAEEVAPTEPPPPVEAQPEPTATPLPENAPPLVGEIPITIFTALNQDRILRITPDVDGTFTVELVRLGRVVYEARYQFYESSNRYENVRSSFEYIEFSDTAGDTSLGCGREPDIQGFFNGAAFEGKIGC